MLPVITKAAATCSALEDLRSYFALHHNKPRLLDAIERFTQNVSSAVHRLQVRELQLNAYPSETLASLQNDFDSALSWLKTNDEALKSKWSVVEATQQLSELDRKLTLAFARKMSLAVFESVQENRAVCGQLGVQIDQIASNMAELIESRVSMASAQGVEKALVALREEERCARPSKDSFADQEAEKTRPSALIDTIARLQSTTTASDIETLTSTPEPAEQTQSERPQVLVQDESQQSPAFSSDSIREMLSAMSRDSTPQPQSATSDSQSRPQETAAPQSAPATTGLSSPSDSLRSSDLPESSQASNTTTTDPPSTAPSSLPPAGSLVLEHTDSRTNRPLLDPVLCADGHIRDRFEVISRAESALVRKANAVPTAFPSLKERDKKKEQGQQILGSIMTLRAAIWDSFPDRQDQCLAQRQSYKEHALTLCGPEGHSQPARAIFALSHVLAYEPEETSAQLLIRRGLLHYRLRNLEAAEHDLSRAIDVSSRGSRRNVDPDARRYRAWVRYTCQNRAGALADINEMLRKVRDPLAIALRASMTALDGNIDGAVADLSYLETALARFEDWASSIARQNMDIVYLAKGWALMSIGQYSDAIADFDVALERRLAVDPYVLASKALAQIISGDVVSGNETMNKALDYTEKLAPLQTASGRSPTTSGAAGSASPISPVTPFNGASMPSSTAAMWTTTSFYDVYLLKGSSSFVQEEFESALEAFERAASLKPQCVRDTGESRYMLACVRAKLGQIEQAKNDFDWAAALKPSQAEFYHFESANMCSSELDQVDD